MPDKPPAQPGDFMPKMSAEEFETQKSKLKADIRADEKHSLVLLRIGFPLAAALLYGILIDSRFVSVPGLWGTVYGHVKSTAQDLFFAVCFVFGVEMILLYRRTDRIRVRLSNGKTGTITRDEFDPKTMTKI